jgi:uncharacterized membrane protein
MGFREVMEAVGKGVDVVGVVVILGGALVATVILLRRHREGSETYVAYRQQLGRSILLGLEFLIAGDIIRTVAIEPTLEGVGVLAAIVVVRTFLSFSLELEITGRWPWQKPLAELSEPATPRHD